MAGDDAGHRSVRADRHPRFARRREQRHGCADAPRVGARGMGRTPVRVRSRTRVPGRRVGAVRPYGSPGGVAPGGIRQRLRGDADQRRKGPGGRRSVGVFVRFGAVHHVPDAAHARRAGRTQGPGDRHRTGWNAGLLSFVAGTENVTSIEADASLASEARARLAAEGIGADAVTGDGRRGTRTVRRMTGS